MKGLYLAITVVLLVASSATMTSAGPDESPTGEIDPYCLEPAPTVSEPCSKSTIWTYDTSEEKCVKMEDCFEDGGQEYNIFGTEAGCHLWCHMIYE